MKLLNSTKKKIVAVGIVGATVLGGSAAFAYWSASGTGTGGGTAASGIAPVVLHASFPAATLVPGGTATVSFTADNGSSVSQAQVGDISVASITTSDANCLPADFSVDGISSTKPLLAAGETGASAGSGTLHMADTDVSQDACKSATITLHLTSN